MTQHGEPLSVFCDTSIDDRDGHNIHGGYYDGCMPREKAARIVACVNACMHLTDAQLQAVDDGRSQLAVVTTIGDSMRFEFAGGSGTTETGDTP